jgi:hypothetical protein
MPDEARRAEALNVNGTPPPDEHATAILIAEFAFVSGLIPFYRRVEIVALGGTGATIAALLAFVGALEAADEPNRALEASLLSLAALVPLVLLLLELMALTRIMRASAYIRTHLYPLGRELAEQDEILRWEFSPTRNLLESLAEHGRGPSPAFAKFFASSAPIVASIALAAVGLPVAGLALDPSDALAPARLVGYAASVFTLAVGGYTLFFTMRFEARSPIEQTERVGGQGKPNRPVNNDQLADNGIPVAASAAGVQPPWPIAGRPRAQARARNSHFWELPGTAAGCTVIRRTLARCCGRRSRCVGSGVRLELDTAAKPCRGRSQLRHVLFRTRLRLNLEPRVAQEFDISGPYCVQIRPESFPGGFLLITCLDVKGRGKRPARRIHGARSVQDTVVDRQ